MPKVFSRSAALAGAAIFLFAVDARAAPPQALNKSITVTYSIFVPGQGVDGVTKSAPRAVTHQLYVSSLGRVFVKNNGRVGNASRGSQLAPESSNFSFAGNSIVGMVGNRGANGMGRMTITFDPSFASCTASMIVGVQANQKLTWTALNGVQMHATGKPEVSGIGCSVSAGNAFAS
jgi:hypothetical protein